MNVHIQSLVNRYPSLQPLGSALTEAYQLLVDCYQAGGKLLLCGNGGSACDCEHIAGELMKGFLLKRPLSQTEQATLSGFGEEGVYLAKMLQRALPALVLSGLSGLSTAFANDVDAALVYAQQAFAYADTRDVLLGISTSGNARNVCIAAIAAKSKGAKVIGLTGESGGEFAAHCDVLINVPETETYLVQELHLPVYHCLCAMLEETFFSETGV
jgi:D-sedoheptulose 7-phosphate isomerase